VEWERVREASEIEKRYEITWRNLNSRETHTFTSIFDSSRIVDLDSNTAYNVAVRAKNVYGRGEISEESTMFTSK